jgi:hypothetical protein
MMDLGETRFQLIKSIGFIVSFVLVYAAQAWLPYRREWRLGTRSWLQNIPMAVVNTIVLSAVCGGCLCAVSQYAAVHRCGLFHLLGTPAALAVPAALVAADSISPPACASIRESCSSRSR